MSLKVPKQEVLEFIDRYYEYDSLTGKLYNCNTASSRSVGVPIKKEVTGNPNTVGYYQVCISNPSFGKVALLKSHICWYLHYKTWPLGRLKFKDGDKTNFRIENMSLT